MAFLPKNDFKLAGLMAILKHMLYSFKHFFPVNSV